MAIKEAIQFLLEHGVSINQSAQDGSTALHYAAIASDEKLIEYLVSNGADVNIRDNNGETALHCAILTNTIHRIHQAKIIDCLAKNGADLNATSNDGKTPWSCARQYFATDYLDVLKKYGSENELSKPI